ncbi:MAG TPA: adenylate/guanylate cyclase domain-containing protein, partial [Chloroflexota bacterium]
MSGTGTGAQSDGNAQALLFARDLAKLNTLRRAYERLVPAPVDREEPTATVREATALFTDLRGFTHLAERFAEDPAALLAVVNEHLAVAVRAVTRCGGVVEKFVGDGLLATFGARAEQPDHRERALAAALGVVGANEALNRRRSSAWGFR